MKLLKILTFYDINFIITNFQIQNFLQIVKPREKKQRKSKLLQAFSIQDTLPAHYKLFLFLYTIVVVIECIFDAEQVQNERYSGGKNMNVLFIPFIVQASLLCLLTFIAIVYFITAYCFGQNKYIYKCDTGLIISWLGITALTIPMSPIYIICYFYEIKCVKRLKDDLPTLFILMIVMLILSIFDFIFCAWIITHLILQEMCFRAGIKQRNTDLMKPMKLENDNKRDVEIQESSASYQTIQETVNSEFSTQVQ